MAGHCGGWPIASGEPPPKVAKTSGGWSIAASLEAAAGAAGSGAAIHDVDACLAAMFGEAASDKDACAALVTARISHGFQLPVRP